VTRSRIAPDAWQAALDDEVLDLIRTGDVGAAEKLVYERLAPVEVAS